MGSLNRPPSIHALATVEARRLEREPAPRKAGYRDAAELCSKVNADTNVVIGGSPGEPEGYLDVTEDFKDMVFTIDEQLGPIAAYTNCMKNEGIDYTLNSEQNEGWRGLYLSLSPTPCQTLQRLTSNPPQNGRSTLNSSPPPSGPTPHAAVKNTVKGFNCSDHFSRTSNNATSTESRSSKLSGSLLSTAPAVSGSSSTNRNVASEGTQLLGRSCSGVDSRRCPKPGDLEALTRPRLIEIGKG